jgi:predicted HAD superfamily Cof-like phosphohydrolase
MSFTKSEHQRRVEKFMVCGGQDNPSTPTIPSPEIRYLRASLILEEAIETIEALGYELVDEHPMLLPSAKMPIMEDIVDGCCDLSVVTIGTLTACGIPDERFLEEVDINNLSKISPDGRCKKDATGKLLKPRGWKPPAIQHLLEQLESGA